MSTMTAPTAATKSGSKGKGKPGAEQPVGGPVAANYQWWRDHGGTWGEEYEARKKAGPKYHVSEFMLCDYAVHTRPFRVLELGCGPCRHLRYLREIPGVNAFGYDQSPAMASGALRWATREWFDEHVKTGSPTGRLPYADGEFDLVYTASVIVHIRPEDLPGILREVQRVSRGHVIHLEPRTDNSGTFYDDHDGCWKHDLVGVYRSIGLECVDLMAGHEAPALFRVMSKGAVAGYTPSPVLATLYQRMVGDLSGK